MLSGIAQPKCLQRCICQCKETIKTLSKLLVLGFNVVIQFSQHKLIKSSCGVNRKFIDRQWHVQLILKRFVPRNEKKNEKQDVSNVFPNSGLR